MSYIYDKKGISLVLAERLIEAAAIKANEINKYMSIAIVDEDGHLKAFRCMDNAALASVGISQLKAHTAVVNAAGHLAHKISEQSKNNPAEVMDIAYTPSHIAVDDGYAIHINGEIIGGLGVSSGTSKQDAEVADAALLILGQ